MMQGMQLGKKKFGVECEPKDFPISYAHCAKQKWEYQNKNLVGVEEGEEPTSQPKRKRYAYKQGKSSSGDARSHASSNIDSIVGGSNLQEEQEEMATICGTSSSKGVCRGKPTTITPKSVADDEEVVIVSDPSIIPTIITTIIVTASVVTTSAIVATSSNLVSTAPSISSTKASIPPLLPCPAVSSIAGVDKGKRVLG
ncbi:hypothetical protein GOBAR_AA16600 [Gossypium barbadense]|uniref:Uncharacterized protein n=1 Tax=Gossypium barbadense TaxID=3634 RepID=A0A2P5XL41_GOSBA|nr:hypothetical protein GOBAR_AA16600 [Gossypium barbadense]